MRTRKIKPKFFINEELGTIAPCNRLLFIGLWCAADRDGFLEDRPVKIKVTIMPYDDMDIDQALTELEAKGFIKRFKLENGTEVIQIMNFPKYQNVHVSESASEISPKVEGFPSTQPKTPNNDHGATTQPPKSPLTRSRTCKKKASISNENRKIAGRVILAFRDASGRDFNPTTKTHLEFINARLKEGHTEDDFLMVIKHKSQQWKNDAYWSTFLRPKTLFNATNFDGYLQDARSNMANEQENDLGENQLEFFGNTQGGLVYAS